MYELPLTFSENAVGVLHQLLLHKPKGFINSLQNVANTACVTSQCLIHSSKKLKAIGDLPEVTQTRINKEKRGATSPTVRRYICEVKRKYINVKLVKAFVDTPNALLCILYSNVAADRISVQDFP